jgi:glucose dehydrogenase
MNKTLRTLVALSAVSILPGIASANSEVQQLTSDPNNWAIWGGNYAGQRYSALDQINAENVGSLQVAWTFSTGVLRGHEGGPLVIGNMLYVHTPFPNKVFAMNLEDQTIKWMYEPKQDPNVIPVMCCDTVNRGLAFADGKVFKADTTVLVGALFILGDHVKCIPINLVPFESQYSRRW